MTSLICAFFISFIVTILVIKTQNIHYELSGDFKLDGPQKMHTKSVPRVGGLGIALGIIGALCLQYQLTGRNFHEFALFICCLPVFTAGFIEDLTKKISVRIRLIFAALSAYLAIILLNTLITHIDIPVIDLLLSFTPIAILFSIFAIVGLTNAYNIIDGFNGLSSMVGMITLLSIVCIGIEVDDTLITFLSLMMFASILGFFVWNYPYGLIFLGDCGAYLIGFWISALSILLVSRNTQISPWFALLINAYPIWETLFTVYRRRFHQGKNPGHPDGIHFHSLIFRRVVAPKKKQSENKWCSANARTSPSLWLLTSMAVVPAIFFWESTSWLMFFFGFFAFSYGWLYRRIVLFKTPRWLPAFKNKNRG